MDKFTFKTSDGIDVNLEKLSRAFPEVITETVGEDGKIKRVADFEKLKMILGDSAAERPQEFYEFTWPGKNEAIFEAAKATTKTLRPCPEESKNWDTTQNLYIEGDNLEALKILQEAYLGKVKMIYIDPPYNTGKDFVYRDNFHKSAEEGKEDETVRDKETDNNLFQNTESNGRFHSDWCSMIYPRLKLARDLLRDDGVIFISIDDNELTNLKKICDEIFGESNFVELFINRSNPRGNQAKKYTASEHEYILSFAKNIKYIQPLGFIKDISEFNKNDELGSYAETGLRKRGAGARREDAPNEYFPIYYDTFTKEVSIYPIEGGVVILPKLSDGSDGRWRWSKAKVEKEKKLLSVREVRRNDSFEYDIFVKQYHTGNEIKKAKSIFYEKEVNNENATEELKKLFPKGIFDYPKPTYTINKLGKMILNETDIILDFFSGSATTAHACMQLNAEDGGNRKFIMVQLPEVCAPESEAAKAGYKNICEIGKERIRRAGEKIKAEHATTAPNLDIGFRVLKVDESNMKEVYYKPDELSQDMLSGLESNIKEDRNDLDLLYACLIDWGVELALPLKTEEINSVKVYTVNDNEIPDLIASFSENITEATIREIAKRKPLRVIFRDSSFADSPSKINVTEIFKTLSPNTTIKVL